MAKSNILKIGLLYNRMCCCGCKCAFSPLQKQEVAWVYASF